jgi:hypothetical protein
MYVTITPQKLGDNYTASVADFVAYLEKENEDKSVEDIEPFFNQHGDAISSKQVIYEIDGNTAKLKKNEPKFYSITLNPSQYELKQLQNHSEVMPHRLIVRSTVGLYMLMISNTLLRLSMREAIKERIKLFRKMRLTIKK